MCVTTAVVSRASEAAAAALDLVIGFGVPG